MKHRSRVGTRDERREEETNGRTRKGAEKQEGKMETPERRSDELVKPPAETEKMAQQIPRAVADIGPATDAQHYRGRPIGHRATAG